MSGPDAHHLIKVLRLGRDDQVELFDGLGSIYRSRITEIGRGKIKLRITDIDNTPPTGLPIHLGQALLKGSKMELVVQKCTELGVAAIHPFLSSHCQAGLPAPEKIVRWQRIIQESCKQCNQPWPPFCHNPLSFDRLLQEGSKHDLSLICWEQREAPPLGQVTAKIEPPRSIMVLIGPEGGYTLEEIEQARSAGFQPVGLGRRTLRAETASIAAIALLQYIFNDLN